MRFQANNLSAPQEYRRTYNSFLGLDYTNAKLDISDKRSPDMQNFVYKDGINQKRNGYDQILKIDSEGNFNGFWEFVDSDKNVHRIAHVGTKFYRVTFSEENFPYDNTFKEIKIDYRPSSISEEDWNAYLLGIKDRRSFAVVRGNRMYILCGLFLVYGDWGKGWELRAVRENEDTYIPTTTTNIRHNSSSVTSTRASFEEVNMMTYYRKNKLFGDSPSGSGIAFERYSPSDYGADFKNTYNKGFQYYGNPSDTITAVGISITNNDIYLGDIKVNLIKDGKTRFINYNSKDVYFTTTPPDSSIAAVIKDLCPAFSFMYTYTSTNLSIKIQLGFINEFGGVGSCYSETSFTYQLDSKNIMIGDAYLPELKITTELGETVFSQWTQQGNYWLPQDNKGNVNEYVLLDVDNGTLNMRGNNKYESYPEPNIEITFATQAANDAQSYKKIDNCETGIIFGYNGIEHFFVTGNSDYPNMDWHTSESLLADEDVNIPNSQNLTYFGELSYAYIGNPQTKIKSYTLLNDNTLGILKEYSHTEASLYVREPFLSDALDPSGNVVLDFNNKPYQKLYYKQYMAAIGEGCVSQYATSNLAGDKIFLSENGVYEIALDVNNLVTNQRYAREKSRLINPVLEQYGKDILKNSIGISYQNRYYLSIGDNDGTVFVADARFRSGDASEMNDTMGYEWWRWTNVPAHFWFVDLEGRLGFGTKDGKLCLFCKEDSYQDNTIDEVGGGGIKYDSTKKNFVISEKYNISENTKIKFITELTEKLFTGDMLSQGLGGVFSFYEEANFDAYIKYLDGKTVAYYQHEGMPATEAVIKQVNYEEKTFHIIDSETKLSVKKNDDSIIAAPIDYEFVTELNEETGEFQLKSIDGQTTIELVGNVNNINKDLRAYIINENPVVAYWITPCTNFDNSDFSKTLKYVTIVPERIDHGAAKVYIYSKSVSKDFDTAHFKFKANQIEGVDQNNLFDNVDLNALSFDVKEFAHSFSKKIKIRNFNFLMLKFVSDNNKNFAIQEFSLTYVVSKRNKGVK